MSRPTSSRGDVARPLREVKCPTCAALSAWSEQNPWRPFCSERCKMIDLGQWAEEKYRIPAGEASSGGLAADEPDGVRWQDDGPQA